MSCCLTCYYQHKNQISDVLNIIMSKFPITFLTACLVVLSAGLGMVVYIYFIGIFSSSEPGLSLGTNKQKVGYMGQCTCVAPYVITTARTVELCGGLPIVQLGPSPSPNPKPKPWFWTKANTKVTFNTHHHHHHPPPPTTHTNF